MGVTESQRETGGDKGRASKSQRKPQREPEGTRVSQRQPKSQGELTSRDNKRETGSKT